MAVKFPNQAQLVGSLLLVENSDRTMIIDSEVSSLTEACEIMLEISKMASYTTATVRKRLNVRKVSNTGWPS